MSSKLRTNEVSWKIEVIGEINNYVRNKQLKITKASGEMTVTAIRKFPDVLLFGGLGEQLLQGWELKMPDTPITADDPLKPAEQKARALGLNSFLVWNARDAALYIKDESDTFVIVKEWPTSVEIKTRDDVDKKKNVWVDRLHDIIDTIEILLSGHQIKAIRAIDTINKEVYSDYIEDASPRIADLIKTEMQHNREFMAEVAKWWSYEKNSYPKDSDRVEILAKIVVVNWMNKFLFAHYLKRYYSVAREVDDLTEKSTVDDGIELFEKICDQCGFADVFGTMIADDCIDDMSWDMLIELNNYLKSVLIQNISPESLQAMLEKVVDISKRETYGQYTTPKVLAKLLVDLTMKDSGEILFDPCCGTGTIIKAAEELKKERGVQNYMETIWASDKFSYPLRLTTFNLFEPDIPDMPLQIFREDIFDLETGSVVTMVYPRSGEHFEKELPVFDTIVSNLPFVNFEAIPKDDKEKMGDSLGRKSDLYAYISIYLSRLLKEEGRVGVIVSNSWLYSEWGQQFKEQLLQQYVLEKVIISQSGRWFKNAKIVTNILILKKKSTDRSEKELTSFISTAHRIEYWADEQIYEEMVTDIWTGNVNSESVYINQYTREEMKDIASVGLGPMVFFTDAHWYRRLKGSVVKGASLFDIKRGERRGWDKMFYPSTTNSIEKKYLKPVVLSSKKTKGLIMGPDGLAFCCSDDMKDLKESGATGALAWIKMFEKGYNTSGKPLVEALARPNMHWYEMSDSAVADLAISVNPGNKLGVFKLTKRALVNQRLIRLVKKNEDVDLDLCHALMNSTLGLLFIESSGFGRGEGVLDLAAARMSRIYMTLDPKKVSTEQREEILSKFQPLLEREMKELPDELKEEDRIAFDKAVLKVYGLEDLTEQIANTLLGVFHIRNAIEVDKETV